MYAIRSYYGNYSFDEIVEVYKQQVAYCLKQNVDMFILETFIDLQEARCAVVAIREMCSLPIIASMTFENGMTLSGNSPECVAIALEAAGADAVGANCSTGRITSYNVCYTKLLRQLFIY